MSTDVHNVCRNFSSLRAALISSVFAFAFLGNCATTALAQDSMRGGDHGGGMRGGMGMGMGVGIGIGIGQGLSQQQPSAPPETPRTSKKATKKSNADTRRQPKEEPATIAQKPALIFVGKPDNVTHNALQKDGKLGDLNDHKQITVSNDGSYFIRHYYFVREGDQRSWYYYDVPDTAAQSKDVPNCNQNDDNCDGPPQHPTYVDNPPEPTPGGAGQFEEGAGPPCGEVRVRSAWTKCENKLVHQLEDTYNYCPPKTKYQVYHSDIPTTTPCDGGVGGWTPPYDVYPLGADCKKVGYLLGPPTIGGTLWSYDVYDLYNCGGKIYRDPNAVVMTDGETKNPPQLPDKVLPPLPAPL